MSLQLRRAVAAAITVLTCAALASSVGAKAPPPRATPLARLSLAQLAGQRIIYAYAGLNPPQTLIARIREGEAAGVIFFAPNIASTGQLRTTVAQLQAANAASPVRAPLLMLVDQEGGLVNRLAGAPTSSEKQIGASANGEAVAAQAGASAARNLASAGITVDLAPVLDVFRAAGNFIDQDQRSYSMNPAVVADLGGAFISELQQGGVAATAKHFPGLGAASASQNTDQVPVTLNVSLAMLRAVDELPYQSAIAAGVKLIMLSWAMYPALDPHLPAGMSPTIIGGELRGRLRFHGVTITDSIGAGALARFGGYAERAALAAEAGADLIICAVTNPADNTPTEGIDALDGIAAAIAGHRLGRTIAEQADQLVIALRAQP